jgi:hypothetical protein
MNALAKSKRAARRINTPAESKGGVANECAGQKSDGGAARGCAGEKWALGYASRGCPSQMEQHQIGGLAANAPANEETELAGNAPAK